VCTWPTCDLPSRSAFHDASNALVKGFRRFRNMPLAQWEGVFRHLPGHCCRPNSKLCAPLQSSNFLFCLKLLVFFFVFISISIFNFLFGIVMWRRSICRRRTKWTIIIVIGWHYSTSYNLIMKMRTSALPNTAYAVQKCNAALHMHPVSSDNSRQ